MNPERKPRCERCGHFSDLHIDSGCLAAGCYCERDGSPRQRVPNPEREDAVERGADGREWVLRWDHRCLHHHIDGPTGGYETEGITVVPKSTLLAAQQRASEAERERDHLKQVADRMGEIGMTTRALAALDRAEKAESQRDDYKARVEELEAEYTIEGDQHYWHWERDKPDGGLGMLRREHPEQTFVARRRFVTPWQPIE